MKPLTRTSKMTVAALTLGFTIAVPWSAAPAQAGTTINVNTTAAGVDEYDGKCSLTEAIYAANFDRPIAIKSSPPDWFVPTGCAAGSGADTIVLPAGAVFTMSSIADDLYNPMGPTATPMVFTPIVIEGNGARIERSGSTLMRAFAVGAASVEMNPGGTPDIASGTGDLTLRNLHIKGFYVHGGDGGQLGGGGGLGAGGAVYVREAALTVENSTFDGNRAEGGNGGNGVNATGLVYGGGGGGGGGLSGAGGNGSTYGGGGGGGGAQGDGGDALNEGGGGGGTVTSGEIGPAEFNVGAAGGEACGGSGGFSTVTLHPYDRTGATDGGDGCDGGGGGGGPTPYDTVTQFCCDGHPGNGGYGGGGGGGGNLGGSDPYNDPYSVNGAPGGFGGGGGAAGVLSNGGRGGFGAGGGGGTASGGAGGSFGGHGGSDPGTWATTVIGAGGAGAGLGGAIFSDGGAVTVRNSTFTGNSVSHGLTGANGFGAGNGSDAGAAIFAVDGTLTVSNATISGNESTGSDAGLTIYRSSRSGYSATLRLTNTIVANNISTSECNLIGSVNASGSGNLFTNNADCPGEAATGDPSLAALAIEAPGTTPTMAIDATSPAFDAGDDDTCEPADQRGVSRPRSLHCDIGAYEYIKPSADLAVATTPAGSAVAGADLAYLIDVHNNGPTAAENVTVSDTLPSNTTFVSITGSGGFTCTGTGPVVCTNPLMSEGATALLTLTVHLAPTLAQGASITNSVSVSSSKTPDPVPANNNASVTSTVSTKADVSVAKTGPSDPVAGANASYSISASNDGPSVARNVTVSDTIPAGTSFQSLTAPAGWSCAAPSVGTAGPTPISCTRADLAPGVSAVFTLVLRLSPSATEGSQLCNTATVSTTTSDPHLADNSSATCGTVRRLADLRITQTASTTGKPGKGTATFRITVTNVGPSDSPNIALSATSSLFTGPPPSTTATSGATCSVAGSTVSCTWPELAVGASVQVAISVPWRSSVGSTCMSASVTTGTPDPNATNNSGGVCIGKR
jgi:uncharacterized repeat protein (TIGR01451 family)